MRIKNWSLLYSFAYILVYIGIVGFYRRRKIGGKENIPKNKPIIFAPNHQSAFLDAAIVGYSVGKPVYFIGRADIFKNKIAKYLLGSLNSLPIYRVRDGIAAVKKNNEAFDKLYDLLEKKYPIAIYPEGNQGEYKQLRSLKKGIFKVGVGAENKYNKKLDTHIIPVGIYYEKHTNMGGDLLIKFGEPIRILDYLEDDPKKQAVNYNILVEELRKRISHLMIDIQKMNYYDLIHTTMTVFNEEIGSFEGIEAKDLESLFQRQKNYIQKIESHIELDQEQADKMKQVESQFSKSINNERLKPWLFRKHHHPTIGTLSLLTLLSPVYLYGLINNYLPYKIPALLVEKKIKDVHFHASVKVILGALLFLVFWTIQVVLVASYTDYYIWLLYLATLFVSALISYKYWIALLKFKGKLKYNKMQKQGKPILRNMSTQFAELKAYVAKIYKK